MLTVGIGLACCLLLLAAASPLFWCGVEVSLPILGQKILPPRWVFALAAIGTFVMSVALFA